MGGVLLCKRLDSMLGFHSGEGILYSFSLGQVFLWEPLLLINHLFHSPGVPALMKLIQLARVTSSLEQPL